MLKQLITFCLCCFVVTDALSNIPAMRSSDFVQSYYLYGSARTLPFPLEAHDDLAIMLDSTTDEIVSLKRGASGFYHRVDSRPHSTMSTTSIIVSTNGRWAARAADLAHEIFELNDDATFINKTFTLYFTNPFGGWIFEDGSYVAFTQDAICTYEFNGTDWSLARKDIPDNYTLIKSNAGGNTLFLRKHLNYISIQYSTGGQIFYRNEDKSWSVFDAPIVFDADVQSPLTHLLWDGNNTLIISSFEDSVSQPRGYVAIYTRGAVGWERTQRIAAASIGITGYGYFGDEIVQVDSDNYIVTAPNDGYVPDIIKGHTSGSVWWLHRDETGTWNVTRRVTSAVNDGRFGQAVALINNGLISVECLPGIDSFPCFIHTAELCYEEATNVTCHDQRLSSCSSFDVDINSLYTINTPAKCGEVSVQANNVIRSDAQGYYLDLTFTRSGSTDVTCTVNALCDNAAPIAPMAVSAPQSPPKDNTSGSQILQSALMILFLTMLIAVL